MGGMPGACMPGYWGAPGAGIPGYCGGGGAPGICIPGYCGACMPGYCGGGAAAGGGSMPGVPGVGALNSLVYSPGPEEDGGASGCCRGVGEEKTPVAPCGIEAEGGGAPGSAPPGPGPPDALNILVNSPGPLIEGAGGVGAANGSCRLAGGGEANGGPDCSAPGVWNRRVNWPGSPPPAAPGG